MLSERNKSWIRGNERERNVWGGCERRNEGKELRKENGERNNKRYWCCCWGVGVLCDG